MEEPVYQELCKKMIKRGGRFPGMDIPEHLEWQPNLSLTEA